MTDLPLSLDEHYTYEWSSTVDALSPEHWDGSYEPGDVSNSHSIWRAIERAALPATDFHYLIGRDQGSGAIAFVVPCYRSASNLDVIAPDAIQRSCARIRQVYRSFLVVRVFIVGSPIAICKSSFGLERIPSEQRVSLLSTLSQRLIAKGVELGCHLAVLKEVPSAAHSEAVEAFRDDFLFVPSLPAAKLPLDRSAPYLGRLRNHYRSVYRGRTKKFQETGCTWESIEDFAPLAGTLCRLCNEVAEKSASNFTALTPEFFREMSTALGGRSFAVVAKAGEKIIGFVLMLREEKRLVPLYLGFDYGERNNAALYYNLLYRIIEESEKVGAEEIVFGQTAYESKSLLGCGFEELWLGMAPLGRLNSLLLRPLLPRLFKSTPHPHHNVMRKDDARSATPSASASG